MQKNFRRHKVRMIDILANFLKFFGRKVSTRHCQFDVKKCRIRYNKNTRLFIGVKDPFIKHLNHGHKLVDKENYKRIILEFHNLLEEASKGQAKEYMYLDYSDVYSEISSSENLRINKKDLNQLNEENN